MDIHTILVTLHLLGFAFGVGGATASDLTFIRSTRDGYVTRSEFNIIKTLSRLIWASVGILLLSGAVLMGMEYLDVGNWNRLSWSWFQLKLVAFTALVVNGIVFHAYVFPLLKNSIGGSFRSEGMRRKYGLFAFTGAVSITSWYTAFLSVAFSGWLIELDTLLLLNGYLLLVSGGALSAYTTLIMHADETSIIRAVRIAIKHTFTQMMAGSAALLFAVLLLQIAA